VEFINSGNVGNVDLSFSAGRGLGYLGHIGYLVFLRNLRYPETQV
jgi:hypothetical protein